MTISTEADLQVLEARDNPPDSGRLIVRLSPSDHIALRDESFARRVGLEAARLNAVVVLNGARLAHIYYVLKKTGADIVTKPIGEEMDGHASFQKLVRDRIPEKVAKGGESVTFASLSPEERLLALRIKLVEEAFEVRDADSDELVEELADVQEVLLALVRAANLDPKDVEAARIRKAATRGAFDEGIQLLETGITSHPRASSPLLGDESKPEAELLRTGKARPFERLRPGGSDRRLGGKFKEFVRDLSVSLSHRAWNHTLRATGFGDVNADEATVSIDAQRKGADLRFRIKLRIGHEQFELPLLPRQDTTREDDVDQ